MFLLQHAYKKTFVESYTRTEVKFAPTAVHCPSFQTRDDAERFKEYLAKYLDESCSGEWMKQIQVYEV